MSKMIALNRMETEPIYFVPVGQLKKCRIQPPTRAGDRRRSTLQANIEREERIYTPCIVTPSKEQHYFDVADGHRRWESAVELGMPTVPCRVIDDGTPAESLFILLNADTARVSGADWLTAWVKAPQAIKKQLSDAYPRRACTIDIAVEVFGWERLKELGLGDVSLIDGSTKATYDPSQARWARRLYGLLADKLPKEKLPKLRDVGEVLLLNGNVDAAMQWIRVSTPYKERDCAKLANALKKGMFLPGDSW